MPVSRFEAEAILRAAASGAIPRVGDTLIRVQDGWVFAQGGGGSSGPITPDQITSLPFSKITGVASRGQLPPEIAYEDEQNTFSEINTFQDQVRRGIRTISIENSPYAWLESDWHLNVNPDGGPVDVLLPSSISRSFNGFTDQLHVKHVGRSRNPIYLRPILGELIESESYAILREPGRSFSLVNDGVEWWVQ